MVINTAGSTHYYQAICLDWIVKQKVPTTFALWLGLLTTDPTQTGLGIEVSGGGYKRILLSPSDFSATSTLVSPDFGSACVTTKVKSFDKSTAPWGLITHYGIWTAQTAGKMLFFDDLPDPQNFDRRGLRLEIPEGDIRILSV